MYLLSTQSLTDAICGHSDMLELLRTASPHEVGISTVSIAEVKGAFEATSADNGRSDLENALRQFLATANNHGAILPFDQESAEIFGRILYRDLPYRHGGDEIALPDLHRMIVATALARNLILVEREQPYHARLGDLRVRH